MSMIPAVEITREEQKSREYIRVVGQNLREIAAALELTGNTKLAKRLWRMADDIANEVSVLHQFEGLRIDLGPNRIYGEVTPEIQYEIDQINKERL